MTAEATTLYIDEINQSDVSDFFSLPTQQWIALVDNMKSTVLGPDYNLTINVVDQATITELNATWRQKPTPTDVLSFPYSETEGELFLCPEITRERHDQYSRTHDNFTLFLIVHALYHLAGYDHGAEMEAAEAKTRTLFNID